MTLSELGSVGELVGGVAVIGSLIYVAVQVRHATESRRTESFLAGLGEGRLLNAPTLNAVSRFISGLFEHSGVVTWWHEQGRGVFTEDFRGYVERSAPA